jgi:hypothetical protein
MTGINLISSTNVKTVNKSSRWLKVLLTVVSLAFFGGGCALGMVAYQAIQEAQQSLNWPTAPGRITRSGVDVSVHVERSHGGDRRRTSRSYSAVVQYEFAVAGRTFSGTRITVISEQFGSKAWAETTSAKYPIGREVTVSYNPERPDSCVLEPGRWGGAGFLLILAGIFSVFPPLVLRAIWSSRPLSTGLHPETQSQRMLQGLEFRERILAWQPGQLVHLQRDSISILTVIGGAIIAGFLLGALLGAVPALIFFSGRGPVFIGQIYLVASGVLTLICGMWLWLDNRPRETRIDWAMQSVHLRVGASLCDILLSDIQEISLSLPEPAKQKSAGSSNTTQKGAARIIITANGKRFIILETECAPAAIRAVRNTLSAIARQLADPSQIPVASMD